MDNENGSSGDKRSGDSTDKGILGFRLGKSKPKNTKAVLFGSVDSDEYCMDLPNRGICLIFNHKEFELPFVKDNKEWTRNGTDVDRDSLKCRFQDLGFEVRVFDDFTVREVTDEFKTVSKENHGHNSCFVCCVLSHGDKDIIYAKDGIYNIDDDLFAPFRGDKCHKSLVGKPKIFFIQACRGGKLDHGIKVLSKQSFDSEFKIPTEADFLVAYSTVPGYYSWRNERNGSWFIQALCAALQKYAQDKDLLKILTIVNRRVAFDFESFTPKDKRKHLKKQVPVITSTLTRDVKFPSRC